jgi:phage head maturation protease
VIGKWFELKEDDHGLYVDGELTLGHSVADDVYASLKHGAINGLSIGFHPVKFTETGEGMRELKEINLIEISVVEAAADLGATVVDIKSAMEEAASLKDVEKALRDAGLSRSDAVALVSRVKSISHGDREKELNEEETRLAIESFLKGIDKINQRLGV